MPKEQWKNVVGYEGLYQVSDMGRIKSLLRNKILKSWKNKNGSKYRLMITLWKNKSKNRFYVHQLVLQAFIGPCPHNMEVCHNDENAENNFITNLRWDTHQNNMKDMKNDGRHWFSNNPGTFHGSKNGMSKVNESQVIQIIKHINDGIPQHQIAKIFNISQATISAIKHKKLWRPLTENAQVIHNPNKGSSRLTTSDLQQIRLLISEDIASKSIAEQFGVSYETINRIKKNQTNKER